MEILRHAHQVKRWRLALNYVLRIFGLNLTQHVLIYNDFETYLDYVGVTTGNVLLDSLPTYHIVCDMERRQDVDEETLKYMVSTQMAYCLHREKLSSSVFEFLAHLLAILAGWAALTASIEIAVGVSFKLMTSYATANEIRILFHSLGWIFVIVACLSICKDCIDIDTSLIKLGNAVRKSMSNGPLGSWLEQSIRELKERRND